MDLNSLLMHELNQKARLLTKEMNERLSKHGLYHSQWTILFCLQKYGGMTQTSLWRYLNVEAPTVTRTLIRLEKNGWIIRKLGTDKREKVVELTEKAKEKLPYVEQTVRTFEQDMTKILTQEQKTYLREILAKLGASETE